MKYLYLTLILCLLTIFHPLITHGASRDLVFEESEPPPAQTTQKKGGSGRKNNVNLAIKTIIELERNGKKTRVPYTYDFKAGDKVRFIYSVNIDGYACWLIQGSSGRPNILFPTEKTGMDSRIKRNQEYTIPVNGSFKFDDNQGVESIFFHLYKEKPTEVCGGAPTAADSSANQRTSRDLVFEEDTNSNTGVSTSSQTAPDYSQPLVVNYNLKHK
ncbi:MAG: DUF4384 domain-containing protein [Nitrospirae bacterium YQR-1]